MIPAPAFTGQRQEHLQGMALRTGFRQASRRSLPGWKHRKTHIREPMDFAETGAPPVPVAVVMRCMTWWMR